VRTRHSDRYIIICITINVCSNIFLTSMYCSKLEIKILFSSRAMNNLLNILFLSTFCVAYIILYTSDYFVSFFYFLCTLCFETCLSLVFYCFVLFVILNLVRLHTGASRRLWTTSVSPKKNYSLKSWEFWKSNSLKNKFYNLFIIRTIQEKTRSTKW